MVSRKQITEAIDRAFEEYERCWATLVKLKNADVSDSADQVLDFQSDLAETLYKLSQIHSEISREKKSYIRRKARLQPDWFVSRMRLLARYDDAIKETIWVGNALGDSFAWLFYMDDRELLLRHQQQQQNSTYISTGLGGSAEVGFIKQIRFIEGYFVVYHGNTSFLRLGDVSLYDFSRRKIVAIGEMKSKKKENDTAGVTVVLTGLDFNEQMRSKYPDGKIESKPLSIDLNPKMKDRLGRQLKKIDQAFAVDESDLSLSSKTFSTPYTSELDSFGKKLGVGLAETQQLGDGVLLIGIKQRKTKPSSRILPKTERSFREELAGLPEAALTIMDRESQDNSIFYSSLLYGTERGPFLMAGMVPLFYWNIDIELIRKIIFGEIVIVVGYNPAHFIRKLRDAGFIVDVDEYDGRKIAVSWQEGDKLHQLENFDYFIRMILLYFYPEEDVLEMINLFIEEIRNNVPPNSIAQMVLRQMV